MTVEPDMYELQIHDEEGPDLSFEADTEDEARAIIAREYPGLRGTWVIISPAGRVVDGTR